MARGEGTRGFPRGTVRPRLSLFQVGTAASVAGLAWFLLHWAHPFGPRVLNWLPVPVLPLLAALTAARVAGLPGLPLPARQVWRALSYSALLTALATTFLMDETLYATGAPRQSPGPLPAALFLTAVLVVLAAVLRLPVRERTRRQWLTVSMDIAIVVVGAGLAVRYATAHAFSGAPLSWLEVALLAFVGVIVAIKVSLTGFHGVHHGAMGVLAAGVIAGTVASAGNRLVLHRPDLNIIMLAEPLIYLSFFCAAELQRRGAVANRAVRARQRLPFSVLPYLVIACCDALLLAVAGRTTGPLRMLVVGSVVLTGLVIVRQVMAFLDNRRYQEQLAVRATHDELTGLPNRVLFMERLEQAVGAGTAGPVTVAVVDLDDFKAINDRFGQRVGDGLLFAVSDRLRRCVRPQDTVARLSGDEFAIVVAGGLPGAGAAVAKRVLSVLHQPVHADGHHLLIQATIGWVDDDAGRAGTAEDLLRRANLAMYEAKQQGKNRCARYGSEMDARLTEHAQLAAELSDALGRGQLHLLYQPIVGLPTGRTVGVEALVRWRHHRDGVVSPGRFIPVAERTGLIVPIGDWVLRTACEQAADWQRRLGERAPTRVSVNVSARQLLEPNFAATVAGVLAETGLSPGRLVVEITETAVFGGGRAIETVAAIHALGVTVALDDFGTGHSSLGLLRTCPVGLLKVDKSFVDDIVDGSSQPAIVTALIDISHALDLQVVAEGVETAVQAQRLHQLGYRLAQGFHFARPLAAGEVEARLGDEQPQWAYTSIS